MNTRSQDTLRTHAHELPPPESPREETLPDPVGLARLMVDHNNTENGSSLSLWSTCHQAPDRMWWSVAWVYDTTGITGDGGDVIMCWWQSVPCPSCHGEMWVEVYDNRDAPVGGRMCPEEHPPSLPVPLQVVTVTGHGPDCDGTCNFGYPDGCCPF